MKNISKTNTIEYDENTTYDIDDQFTLKVRSNVSQEGEKLVELKEKVHGNLTGKFVERLLSEYPKEKGVLWFYIEDNYSNQIISSLTLFPLIWNFEGIILPICEMILVGTHEEYRGKGLIGKINEIYEMIMKKRGYLISIIRGNPFYYRRFNYEFAIPLDDRIHLTVNKIPSIEIPHIKIKKAGIEDLPFIKKKYEEYHSDFCIHSKFDKDGFKFKFMNVNFSDTKLSTYILEENGKNNGYFSIGMSYDNEAHQLVFSQLNFEQMIKILQFLKDLKENQKKKELLLALNIDSPFGKYIISLGGIPNRNYAWQIKIVDLKLFFERIKPILEKRLKKSIFQNLTKTILISDYRETIKLSFIHGKITSITIKKGYPTGNEVDVKIPGSTLFKLLLSDKTFNEIKYIFPDSDLKSSSKLLIDVLFPKKKSFPITYSH